MFHKYAISKIAFITFAFAAVLVPTSTRAGAPNGSTIEATTPATISAGGSVTFRVTYFCSQAWTSASAQLYLNQQISNTLGQSKSLTPPTNQGAPTSETFTAQFQTPGTYTVDVSISNVSGPGSTTGCPSNSAASEVTVTVTAAATTTTTSPAATTTTVAATTTTAATSLPKTGTDSNNALIALAVMTAGVAIIAGRRRLLTK